MSETNGRDNQQLRYDAGLAGGRTRCGQCRPTSWVPFKFAPTGE